MITVARILMKAFIPRIRLGNVVTKGPSIAQEAGEGFTESHQRRDCVRIPKYHPRQWVDASGTAYNELGRLLLVFILFPRCARKKNDNNVHPTRSPL